MRTAPSLQRRTPPPPSIVRAALASHRSRLCPVILPMAEANATAAELGACIGCLKGDKLAIGLVDEADGRVVALAVCASPSVADLVDPHTLEVRCLLVDPARGVSIEALWTALERKAGERGCRRLLMCGARALPPALPATGWSSLRACGIGRCGGVVVPGTIWSKVLRGERH